MNMSSKAEKSREPVPYKALLDENHALKNEVESLKASLEEAEELRRAISEGDLDALVLPGPEGKMVFTLDSADYAYRVLVETMNEGTATLAFDGTILYCNRHFAELLRMPLPAIVGTSIYRFIVPDSINTFKAILGRERGKGEINLQAEGGKALPVYLSISLLQTRGFSNAWCLVISDLTEQKRNEEMLANIETARKKEIHHRIKNNLQVISSLLDLQAERFSDRGCIKDSEILEAFRVSQDRVISMALIHEELHEGGEVDALNFSPYLERLAENLLRTYRLGDSSISLNMELEEDIFFDMDTAVPLGLIVNELVSNSLKYAFPGMNKGEIRIKLFSQETGNELNKKEPDGKSSRYTLVVSDNGTGIPDSVDLENPDTLGLQLVSILVDQLDGEMELKRDNGTEFIIKLSTGEKLSNKL
ncbi:PAS domain-containing protein [Methanosarcina sp. MSH10X1]|uniref:histidine kinase dimerization/phosphoacceptor domain -containing protein n=1 Tax=Methanosarcina sp. MSH10X1 TaxID=2507075 RepID=UPI000FFB2159|nr:histidine kinase dimerization/phosphoacceptor domain -containing protein [Methanosarcina sp. MSH10X1]RXA17610.1 PAS domain-containing protein [Methanosarcina sp. MSH10X1]